MILLDTNVIVDFWRKPTDCLHRLFEEAELCFAGVTRAELMHGARSPSELERIEGILAGFDYLPTPEKTWTPLGENMNALRRAGITVSFQDVLLATLAIENGLEVWTYDTHFQMMQGVLTELRLFQPDAD